MPCDGSYMNPSQRETDSLFICKRIVFLFKKLNFPIPKRIVEAADSLYGDVENLDENVAILCGVIRQMKKEQVDSIIYNARSKESRDLANWWEEHQEADSKRKNGKQTVEEKETFSKLFSILSKLSQEEFDILSSFK
ncbi:MAG: hypothetical protein EKK64_00900 [Neisseriaceae bacterium]|nr:MAG: hypothetical protein EKK64_00900 [Neisseriaceae bacterium]